MCPRCIDIVIVTFIRVLNILIYDGSLSVQSTAPMCFLTLIKLLGTITFRWPYIMRFHETLSAYLFDMLLRMKK